MKTIKILAFGFYVLIIFSSSRFAMSSEMIDGSILTVEQATKIAVQNNPSLAELQSRYQALKEVPSQAGSLPDPMLNFGAANFPTDTFDRTQEGMTQLQIGFSQVFPFPGKLDLSEQAAEFDAKAAFYSVDEMRVKLVGHVASSWWQVYYLDRAIETITNNQVLLRQFIEVAEVKYKTGKGLQQDVLLAQLELSKLTDQKIQVISMRQSQAIRLNALMGASPIEKILMPVTVNTTFAFIKSEKELYAIAEETRPSLKMREQKLSAANSRLDLAKRDLYPDFKVSLRYADRSGLEPVMSNSRSDLFSIMLGVKIPLYTGSKQSKAINQKSQEYQQNRYALIDEKISVMADISTGVSDFEQAKEKLLLYKTGIVPQARQTVQSMLAGYQVSEVDFLNLVRSQVTLFNYELLYWKSLTEAKQALTRIRASVGGGAIYE